VPRVNPIALAILGVAVGVVYVPIASSLAHQWLTDPNYSHGLVVPFLALWFAWMKRDAWQRAPVEPAAWGAVVFALGLLVLTAGTLGAELFLMRVSLLPILAGSIIFLAGPARCRTMAFPLLFLVLMIPLPEIVFNRITLPLQLFASQAGELALRTAGVPVLRDGNVIELVGVRLEVADACSGIRSLMTLITFALAIGRLRGCSRRHIAALCLATIPVAVIANAARVAGIGLAAHWFGQDVAAGFVHEASGLVVFAVAVAALFAIDGSIRRGYAEWRAA
jgi:exosortase